MWESFRTVIKTNIIVSTIKSSTIAIVGACFDKLDRLPSPINSKRT